MKKSIFASIPLSIFGVLGVHLVYGITNLIISLLFLGISYIPIIKNIVGYIMKISDNTPDMFAVFMATIIAYFVFSAFGFNPFYGRNTTKVIIFLIGSGIILSIVAQLGDMFESFIKRKLKIKDMGNLLPGHGGLLDRIDGLTFSSLATWILYSFLF